MTLHSKSVYLKEEHKNKFLGIKVSHCFGNPLVALSTADGGAEESTDVGRELVEKERNQQPRLQLKAHSGLFPSLHVWRLV